jgi:hypothetical protein
MAFWFSGPTVQNMRNKVLTHKLLIRTIGETRSSNIEPGLPFSSLRQFLSPYSTDEMAITEELRWLVANQLVTEEVLGTGERVYSLSEKGYRIFHAIQGRTGLTLSYEDVAIKTLTNDRIRTEVEFIEAFYENWAGELVHVLADELAHKDSLHDSLFICYAAAQSTVFDWLKHSLFSGCYEVVLRELRSILEGLFTAYNLDVNYPTLKLDEKLDTMRELEEERATHGKKVFTKSGVKEWKDYYSLYQELCAYVHLSLRKIQSISDLHGIDSLEPEFDEDEFIKCAEAWKKVATLAVELASSLLKTYNINFEIHFDIFVPQEYGESDDIFFQSPVNHSSDPLFSRHLFITVYHILSRAFDCSNKLFKL